MVDQREEMEQQNSTMIRQRFEMTLFQMLNLQQELISALKHQYNNKSSHVTIVITGREVFQYMYEKKQIKLSKIPNCTYTGLKGVLKTRGLSGYEESNIPPIFDHYFRHFYRILKYIDQSQDLVDWDAKYKYIGIVRGQLSRYELVWIYYNSIFYSKMKKLVEKYAVLKSLRSEYLVTNLDLGSNEYVATAFDAEKARKAAM